MSLRAIIVDDEEPARLILRQLLEEEGVEIIGEAESAEAALTLAAELTPDFVTLDIRMHGLDGLRATTAFGQLNPAPLIVLCTAYAEHAVEAYERAAFDYMLKPVSPERVSKVLGRIRAQLAQTKRQKPSKGKANASLARLPIRSREGTLLVPYDKVLCAFTREKSVYVQLKDKILKTGYTLGQLEQVLPSGQFMRTHSGCIVNLASIEEILTLGNHLYGARLSGGHEVPVGRNQYPLLLQRLGVDARAAAV